jgi:formate hydrogenlyase subunit 6/NADH:ubiquinone oxidoreductase subunit I
MDPGVNATTFVGKHILAKWKERRREKDCAGCAGCAAARPSQNQNGKRQAPQARQATSHQASHKPRNKLAMLARSG